MTKQLAPIEELAEAQKHEDMLLELYKFHAYIPNDAMGNPLTPFGNFCEGWQAATEQSQKEIEALQAREKELVEAISSSLNCIREEINLNNYTETALGDFISGYGDMVIILEQALATVRGDVNE